MEAMSGQTGAAGTDRRVHSYVATLECVRQVLESRTCLRVAPWQPGNNGLNCRRYDGNSPWHCVARDLLVFNDLLIRQGRADHTADTDDESCVESDTCSNSAFRRTHIKLNPITVFRQ